MKGHVRERSPGRWAIVLDLKDPETGKRRRKWHSFTGTKRQADVECACEFPLKCDRQPSQGNCFISWPTSLSVGTLPPAF